MIKFRRREGEEVCNERKNGSNFGKYTIWVIGIIFIIIGYLFNSDRDVLARLKNTDAAYNQITTELSAIKQDISWIRETLQRLNK